MRKLELGSGVVVIPFSLVAMTEREIDAKDTSVLVIYPDDTKGSELDEIIHAISQMEKTNAHNALDSDAEYPPL